MSTQHFMSLIRNKLAEMDGNAFELPRFSIYQRYEPSSFEAMVYEPTVCLILQGRKTTGVGKRHITLGVGDALLVRQDTPVMSRITHAHKDEPYTALILTLDLMLAQEIYNQMDENVVAHFELGPLSSDVADETWLEPLVRYMNLMDDPMDAKVLGASIMREIHYRLLLAPIGQGLRQLLILDSHAGRVAKAIAKLRGAFQSPLSVADLADLAGMSPSSFHAHFKAVTRTTPRQFQKDLRLIEARALLAEQGKSVSDAAFAVGYESPTHFSNDYSRKFGLSPSKDRRMAMRLTETAR